MSQSKHKLHLLTDHKAISPFSEAFRQLRTNMEFSTRGEAHRVVLIASAVSGEGRSTAAANLAISFAQTGKRVLLVDAHLRKPTLHHYFGVANQAGLTAILRGQRDLQEGTVHTFVDGLELLPAGLAASDSTELLSSSALKALLEQLRSRYEVVLIDTPPLLQSSDAQVLGALSDGVMLVVDAGKVKRATLEKAKASLDLVKANTLGAILNNTKVG